MAKRRTAKRTIHLACTEMLAECVAVSLYASAPNEANVEALLHAILKLEKDYIGRISHVEPGMKPRAYFKDMANGFMSQVGEIYDQINNLH